jgi:hypothetical protein
VGGVALHQDAWREEAGIVGVVGHHLYEQGGEGDEEAVVESEAHVVQYRHPPSLPLDADENRPRSTPAEFGTLVALSTGDPATFHRWGELSGVRSSFLGLIRSYVVFAGWRPGGTLSIARARALGFR